MIMRTHIFLFLILLLALFLRTYDLSNNPPELFSDEIINYVSAKSVIETGKDLYGRFIPYFSDRLELRPPIYGYTAYLSSLILGEGIIAIRAPAVFFGLITIIAVYLLAFEFFGDRRAALLSAFFMAIIPWHIHYSRVGWEPAAFLPFLLLSTFFLVHGINKNRKYLIALAFGLFTLTIYTYQAAPLYSFIFLFPLILINYQYFLREKKLFLICIIISLILVSPYIWTVDNEDMMYYRAKAISTFSSGLNSESLSVFAHNYISHFKPAFLFTSGDPNLRHGAGVGTIYWIMLPLILIGIIQLIKSDIPRRHKIFIAIWILIFPLGGSLTNDGVPHATRTLPGAPLLCIMSGIGFGAILKFIKLKTGKEILSYAFTVIILVLSLLSLGHFARNYYYEYPKRAYLNWDYGHKDIFSKIKSIQDNYQRACLQNLNYWHELQLIEYYLKDTHLEITNDINDPKCLQNGSIIVLKKGSRNKIRNSTFIDSVRAPDDRTLYYIYVIK